jgi:hypothetical protein
MKMKRNLKYGPSESVSVRSENESNASVRMKVSTRKT